MYKIFLLLLATAMLGLGLTGPALFFQPSDYQYATISEDTSEDMVADVTVQKLMNQEVPQVGHEPMPPPPPPPPDDLDQFPAVPDPLLPDGGL